MIVDAQVHLWKASTPDRPWLPNRGAAARAVHDRKAFGPQRCHWGTDITNSFAKCTYRQRITHFTETLDFLSDEDRRWVMGDAIRARLGWS